MMDTERFGPGPVFSVERVFDYDPDENLQGWTQAEAMLEGFVRMAEASDNEALLVALTDCHLRTKEELKRASEAVEREEGKLLSPMEEERLMQVIRRSDRFNDIYTLLFDDIPRDHNQRGRVEDVYLPFLERERDAAHEEARRAKRELFTPGDLS